ncbi:MAG: diguanylate cyclase, partial [bacterium]|nr:diguanylate cyclase [bacterium]
MTDETLGIEIVSEDYAVAVSQGLRQNFVFFNPLFSQRFPEIDEPGKLHDLITGKTKSKTVVGYRDKYWELLELQLQDGYTLHLLKDITHEKEILQKLKAQLKDLTVTNTMYSEILTNDLPIGVLIVDKNFNVSFVNTTQKRFFHIPAKARLRKCFNYVKELKPCKECILRNLLEGGKKNKKTFQSDDRFITAEIFPLEGDKFLITFRDTTKEINLIQEIKKQQDRLEKANQLIAAQNDILKRLSNINIRIGQLKDLDAILGVVVNSIIETVDSHRGAIVLFNLAGQIEDAYFTGTVGEEERELILKSIDEGKSQSPDAFNDYTVVDMIDNGEPIGRLFVHTPEKAVEPSILELFLMQVNNYLQNLKLQRKLEELAQTDSLTGVFNRYYFDKQFKKESELSMRFGQPLSIIIIDVNGLKQANDNIGHEAGDLLLQKTASFLASNVSTFDSIYRIGGDEFVIILYNCPENQLSIMIEMFKEMQSVADFQFKEQNIPIRFSLGGACS